MRLRGTLYWASSFLLVSSLGCTTRSPEERQLANPSDRSVEAPTGPPAQLPLPELAEFEQPNAVLLAGRVYPLGWSHSGLFAYVYEPPDEALAALWQLRGEAWAEHLDGLGIERQASMNLHEFAEPGHGLHVEFETTQVRDDSPVGFAHIERYGRGRRRGLARRRLRQRGARLRPARGRSPRLPRSAG